MFYTCFTGFPIVPYRALRQDTDVDAPIPFPVLRRGLGNGLRDPTSFRKTCIVRPSIDPPREIDTTAGKMKFYFLVIHKSTF